jgi:Pyruvate/2-oxoacid:ferredoxin oxidoreductase delta subunit/flavodoxin
VIKRFVIYYFSGTGNAKKLADWLCELASQHDIPAVSCDIASGVSFTAGSARNYEMDDTLVFIAPIHGFNYTPTMSHFVRHLDFGKNNVILLCTRAGLKLGSCVTPGVTGVAFITAMGALRRKGYRIISCQPFDMPSNWLTVHPALAADSAKFIFQANQKRLEQFFDKLMAGTATYRWGVLSSVLAPISAAYAAIGRFFIAKSFYADSTCTSCGKCITSCPVKALVYKDKRPYWTLKCESCMRCINICPAKSIQAGHAGLVFSVASCWVLASFFTQGAVGKIACASILLVPVQFLLYKVQHSLLKIPFIEKIIKRTSLTSYKFWR